MGSLLLARWQARRAWEVCDQCENKTCGRQAAGDDAGTPLLDNPRIIADRAVDIIDERQLQRRGVMRRDPGVAVPQLHDAGPLWLRHDDVGSEASAASADVEVHWRNTAGVDVCRAGRAGDCDGQVARAARRGAAAGEARMTLIRVMVPGEHLERGGRRQRARQGGWRAKMGGSVAARCCGAASRRTRSTGAPPASAKSGAMVLRRTAATVVSPPTLALLVELMTMGRCVPTITHGVVRRSTPRSASRTNVCCSPPGVVSSSDEKCTVKMGPIAAAQYSRVALPSAPGIGKRFAAGTPHSPPLSLPLAQAGAPAGQESG